MNTRIFILTRDRSEARRIRRLVAESGLGFNVQVGTWLELVNAGLEAYLLSESECCWQDSLSHAIEFQQDAFWSRSYTVAPAETTAVISAELDRMIRGLSPGKILVPLSDTDLSERAQRHLADLSRLYRSMDGLMPTDLEAAIRILDTPSKNALRLIRVCAVGESVLLNPWQKALVSKLNRVSSSVGIEEINRFIREKLVSRTPKKTTSLNLLQQGLYQDSSNTGPLDDSLQWLAARDYMEEVEIVAGMIQTALKADEKLKRKDLALLLPDDQNYSVAVREVFNHAGLPLSGLVVKQEVRDLGREVVFHLLLTLRKPAPTMAMAAFVTSPLLPWTRTQGFAIAAALMGGDYSLKRIKHSTSAANNILDFIRNGVGTVADLKQILLTFPKFLNESQALEPQRVQAVILCKELQKQLLATDSIPWDALLVSAAPHPERVEVAGELTREGIAIFYEHEEPWREVKTLYVLGFNSNHYPREPQGYPIFSATDIRILKENGYELESPVDIGNRQRSRFRRQLSAAEKDVHFLISRRDSYGKELAPSSSLPFMAQLFDRGEEPESLILELDTAEGRRNAVGLAFAPATEPVQPRTPEISDLTLATNLLEIQKDDYGKVRRQSPSSLETLMTSPLAWLLNRFDLEPKEWEPEKLDVMSKGTLAHAVFEALFAPGHQLPGENEVKKQVPALLREAIVTIMPFLNRPEWKVERYHLEKEIMIAAGRWREVLETIGAKVLGVEVWLSGLLGQQPIHGSADLLFELPDGKVYVVDYKKSSSKKRKERMKKGFDSQASLYRIMLQTGEAKFRSSDGEMVTVEKDREIGALYYLMNDQVALADSDHWLTEGLRDFEELGADISSNALPLIKERLSQVKKGHILLNNEVDEKWFEKEAGMPLYALENSPLIRMFMHRDQEEGE